MSKNEEKRKNARGLQLERLLESFNKKAEDLLDKVAYEPQCKICNSKYRMDIDDWILAGIPYREIVKSVKKLGETISPTNLSNHWTAHVEAPLIREVMKLIGKNRLKMVDSYEKLLDTFVLWREAVEAIKICIDESDPETAHTKISVLNNLIKTNIKMIEVLGKFQGHETTKKNITPSSVEEVVAEVKDEIAKSQ